MVGNPVLVGVTCGLLAPIIDECSVRRLRCFTASS